MKWEASRDHLTISLDQGRNVMRAWILNIFRGGVVEDKKKRKG